MFTNQPSWSGPFGLVVTSTGYGAGGPGSSPTVGTCGAALSYLLHWGLVRDSLTMELTEDMMLTRSKLMTASAEELRINSKTSWESIRNSLIVYPDFLTIFFLCKQCLEHRNTDISSMYC
jgi:hypothetical protein